MILLSNILNNKCKIFTTFGDFRCKFYNNLSKSLLCEFNNNKSIKKYKDLNYSDKVTFTVVDYDFNHYKITSYKNEILYKVFIKNNIKVYSECSGQNQCGMCHCILSNHITEHPKYIEPNENEIDSSHILSPLTNNSRFSCSTLINEAFEGNKVYLIDMDSINKLKHC